MRNTFLLNIVLFYRVNMHYSVVCVVTLLFLITELSWGLVFVIHSCDAASLIHVQLRVRQTESEGT